MGIYRRTMSGTEKVWFSSILFLQIYIIVNVSCHIGLSIPYIFDVPLQYQTFVYFVLPEVVLTVVGFSWAMHFVAERRSGHPLAIALILSSLCIFPVAVFFPAEFTAYLQVLVQGIQSVLGF